MTLERRDEDEVEKGDRTKLARRLAIYVLLIRLAAERDGHKNHLKEVWESGILGRWMPIATLEIKMRPCFEPEGNLRLLQYSLESGERLLSPRLNCTRKHRTIHHAQIILGV